MPTKPSRTAKAQAVVPAELIERRIFLVRGQKIMLDTSLAEMYGVPAFRLNEAVKRNQERFPSDFMYKLTLAEGKSLTSQIAMSKTGRGGRRTTPYAFTEQGVAMLSSVLNSDRAVQVNIAIMRAFVKVREIMATHKDLANKIEALERSYAKHDEEIQVVFQAIKQLLKPPSAPPKRRIGFRAEGVRA
jgi:hypothetical protein